MSDAEQPKKAKKSRPKSTDAPAERARAAPRESIQQPEGGLRLDELVARGLIPQAAWRGRLPQAPGAPLPETLAVAREGVIAPAAALTPVQAAIDRSVPPDVFSHDIPITANGKTLAILRRPAGYPSGPLPADPGRFPPQVDPRSAICSVLSPLAGARCMVGRYF